MPSEDVTPWQLAVPERDLDDLRVRLRATRWPEPATDRAQGVGLEELRTLCAYWSDGYDWHRAEARLNKIGQFRTTIDGLGIHFLHSRSSDPDALAIVLTHGWPGSVIEYLEVIGPLNEAGFHCVVPSLPGYGWSDKPTEVGWNVERIARAWAALMARLGYARYGAQGSDWGTSVSAILGRLDAGHVAGIHLMPPLVPPDPATFGDLTDQEQQALEAMKCRGAQESGYSTMHRTRPQTIGYALTDSPAGLAAWITEKLRELVRSAQRAVTRPDPRQRDALLASPHRSIQRPAYWESLHDVTRWLEGPLQARDHVDVPTGCSVFPYELQRPSRRWAERRFHDIRYWNEPPRGGHFAAMEQPSLFVDELTAFFTLVR